MRGHTGDSVASHSVTQESVPICAWPGPSMVSIIMIVIIITVLFPPGTGNGEWGMLARRTPSQQHLSPLIIDLATGDWRLATGNSPCERSSGDAPCCHPGVWNGGPALAAYSRASHLLNERRPSDQAQARSANRLVFTQLHPQQTQCLLLSQSYFRVSMERSVT